MSARSLFNLRLWQSIMGGAKKGYAMSHEQMKHLVGKVQHLPYSNTHAKSSEYRCGTPRQLILTIFKAKGRDAHARRVRETIPDRAKYGSHVLRMEGI